ncbi:cupin domain-containing protein [Novosphingobium sp. FKTRR1]|uniref:cupin domain-containing protein n=1 Tax=Novosphingobium sp. FKTRR1 TaxID=2879118 RepID=UPI001CF04973|nr:cupin domain-containing protein [Novosphingobium sp. FKTRR1]
MPSRSTAFVAGVALVLLAGLASNANANAHADLTEQPAAWTLDAIAWQTKAANGTRYALLEGDRGTGNAPFSYAFSIPAGVFDAPHRHSATARVFVAKGVLEIGFGDRFDPAALHAYPAGSYVIVPANMVHFDGSHVDTVIIGTATGPWSTAYLDGSQPVSAGTPVH